MLNVLSHRLHCLIKLNILLISGTKKSDAGEENDRHFLLTIRSILSRGNKGVLSELVAQHIVVNEYPAKLLSIFDDEDEIGEITRDEIKSSREDYLALLNVPANKEFYSTKIFFCIFLLTH